MICGRLVGLRNTKGGKQTYNILTYIMIKSTCAWTGWNEVKQGMEMFDDRPTQER